MVPPIATSSYLADPARCSNSGSASVLSLYKDRNVDDAMLGIKKEIALAVWITTLSTKEVFRFSLYFTLKVLCKENKRKYDRSKLEMVRHLHCTDTKTLEDGVI
jgi:hypothetical protein